MSEMKQGLYHVKWWLRGVYGDPEGEFDILTSDDDAEIREEAWNRAQKMTNAGRPEYLEFIKVLVTPADPPPAAQPDDDARIAEIHERLAKITPGEWEHSQTHTFHNYVQVLPAGAHQYVTICQTSTGEHSRGVPEAQFIAAAPADLRFLLARLSAVTKRAERAEKFCAEIAELSVLSSTIQYMNASADVLGKFILANPDEYRRIMTQYHAKESTDG